MGIRIQLAAIAQRPLPEMPLMPWSLIVLFDLRHTSFYVAVAFVVYDDDPFWRDLALGTDRWLKPPGNAEACA